MRKNSMPDLTRDPGTGEKRERGREEKRRGEASKGTERRREEKTGRRGTKRAEDKRIKENGKGNICRI